MITSIQKPPFFGAHTALAGAALALITSALSCAQATTITVVGPFASTGTYMTIPNGSFESGSMAGFSDIIPSRGVITASSEAPFLGQFSARANTLQNMTVFGYGSISGPIAVTPGVSYVLSAYFNSKNLASGNLYIDLNDASFDSHATAINSLESWQFAYTYFVPTSSTINVRIIRDGTAGPGPLGYIDDVAVTRADQFAPAVAVPEPATWLMASAGTLLLLRLARRKALTEA